MTFLRSSEIAIRFQKFVLWKVVVGVDRDDLKGVA